MEPSIEAVATANLATAPEPQTTTAASALTFLRQLGAGRLAALGLTALGLLGFFAYLLMRVAEADYALLYAGLELEDSAEVVGLLEAQNIPYRLRDDGATVLVPADQALRMRMALAEQGLPRGGSVGYEIFDQLSAFGTTNFLADVNLKRALEGELARTITAIADVRAARVHLVMPKRELFRREQIEPSASVTLKMAGGRRLSRRQALAIQHLVAASVPGLAAERITLVDDLGNLLARGGDLDQESLVASESEEFRATYEARIKRTVEELLARSLGPDRVRAQVHAEMDFDRVTTTQETFDPDGRVVRSTQNVEEETAASERDRNENVSVANNLPNTGAADAAGRTSSETTTRSEETVNYEISRTVRNHTQVGGRVRRLSVAVLVDGRMVPDGEGELVYAELEPAELEQIETLVRSAVGFDEARGDVVEVINMPFNLPPPAELEEPWLDIDKHDMLRLLELLVLAAIALVLIIFVIRPSVRHLLPAGDETLAAAGGGGGRAALGGPDGGPASRPALTGPAGAAGGAGGPVALPAPLAGDSDGPAVEERVDIERVQGGVSKELLERAMEACDEVPDDAIRVLRTWLHQDGATE